MSDAPRSNFIREIVEEHLRTGRFGGKVVTRFPPEPNGYLHIGHAKAICIDFGLARDYGGRCHLRFDDTNPTKESQEYVDAIMNDVRWLGFDWGKHLHHASDYFEQLYEWAEQLIKSGKAYVDDQTVEEMRESRGTLTEAGRPSPHRDRSVEENLELFRRMRAGEFPDGSKTLRAKIDMTSGNINLRDPVMYRIRKTPHQRTGDAWRIYPMYDWAHGQSDSIEGVSRAERARAARAAAARAPPPRGPQHPRPAPHGRPAPAEAGHHELSRRQGRAAGRRQQSRGSLRRHAQGAVRPRAVDRAGRLQRSGAQEVFPPHARRRGSPPLRLHRQVHRFLGRAGRPRHRGALHLRSRHRRRRQRRPHRQGHPPLGVGRPRRRIGGAPVRDAL